MDEHLRIGDEVEYVGNVFSFLTGNYLKGTVEEITKSVEPAIVKVHFENGKRLLVLEKELRRT